MSETKLSKILLLLPFCVCVAVCTCANTKATNCCLAAVAVVVVTWLYLLVLLLVLLLLHPNSHNVVEMHTLKNALSAGIEYLFFFFYNCFTTYDCNFLVSYFFAHVSVFIVWICAVLKKKQKNQK